MSSWRVPLTTSNGENCTAPGSRDSNLGIILAPRASLTPQVRVNVNCSATSTAFLSVFHQHLIRSDVSLFSAFDRGACACANSTVKNTTITAAHTFKLQSLLTMTTLLHRKAHAHRTHEKMSRHTFRSFFHTPQTAPTASFAVAARRRIPPKSFPSPNGRGRPGRCRDRHLAPA